MTSAFRTAVETAAEAGDVAPLIALLAEDVEFRSPVVYAPFHGREAAARVLRAVFQVWRDFAYTLELRDGDREILMFTAKVGDREIQGCDFVRFDGDGRVSELTVMMRPLSGLNAVMEGVNTLLKPV
jgi:ketosteroid isomerase-like protein